MKKRKKNKIHNAILYFITWLMAVTFITTGCLMHANVDNIKPAFVVAFVISVAWIIAFLHINYKYIERMCEEE